MNYETSYNKNITSGYAFDGFLTKVKTDSFDYFKFLETENRILYSELKEGEAYLYKGQKYTGLAISFYDNGQLAFAASYKDGKLNGWWRKWEENGSLFLETEYVDGEMVSEIDFN
jgi:antitoxin component YwqK of YwqJK toxin-antitoxin module